MFQLTLELMDALVLSSIVFGAGKRHDSTNIDVTQEATS
jgi:hypothetical protein